MRRVVATASNEMEAELICGRLADAGVRSMQELANNAIGGRFGGGGQRDVYVEEQDLEAAREALGLDAEA
jgi:hypothetical protein